MTTRSRPCAESITVTFYNASQNTYKGYWVDYEGNEKHYYTLVPNAQQGSQTFLSHVWVFRCVENNSVKMFAASKKTIPGCVVNVSSLDSELETVKTNIPTYEMPKRVHTPLEYITLPSDLKSRGGGDAAKVTFTNLSADALDVFWVDYSGGLSKYGTVRGGDSISSQSYNYHPFVFKHGNGIVAYHIVNGDEHVKVGLQNVKPVGTAIENSTETSCHDFISRATRAGKDNLCFVENTSLFAELYHHLQQIGKRFIDEEFPPQKHWARATDIYEGTECVLYKDGIVPGDVLQGQVGNCWLMQAIAGAATQPDKIQEMFKYTIESTKTGLYVVRLYYQNSTVCMLLDDYLPCDEYGTIRYARMSEPGELWVCILEKAFAKLDGSYDSLEGAKTTCGPSIALTYMLGGVPHNVDLRTQEQRQLIKEKRFWPLWEEKRRRNIVIVCTTMPNEGTDLVNERGLVHYHGYSILDLRHFGELLLLQVRNTWGKSEWNGAWSDNSTEWQKYPMVRKQLEGEGLYEKKDDGIFWIEAKDFLDNFCVLWWNEL
jgi:hypothetical protein